MTYKPFHRICNFYKQRLRTHYSQSMNSKSISKTNYFFDIFGTCLGGILYNRTCYINITIITLKENLWQERKRIRVVASLPPVGPKCKQRRHEGLKNKHEIKWNYLGKETFADQSISFYFLLICLFLCIYLLGREEGGGVIRVVFGAIKSTKWTMML